MIGGGTPEANDVLDRHWGQVSQYINAQHQRAQLSGLPQHKSSSTIGDVRVTYTNNHGQDTVVVEVASSSSPSSEETKPTGGYWDWALVELVIPNVSADTSGWEISTFLPKPLKGETVFAWNGLGYNSTDNILRFADVNYDGAYQAEASDLVASLLVDLRKFQHPGAMEIDLYGFVYPISMYGLPTDGSKYTVTGSHQRAHRGRDASPYTAPYTVSNVSRGLGPIAVIASTPGTYDALIASFPALANQPYQLLDNAGPWNDGAWSMEPAYNSNPDLGPVGWSDPVYLSPSNADPNTFLSHFAAVYSETWDYWDADNFYVKTFVREGVIGGPGGFGDTSHTTNTISTTDPQMFLTMYDYTDYWIPSCNVYQAQQAYIRAGFFKGGPPDRASYQVVQHVNVYMWEVSRIYPQRPHMSKLEDIPTVTSQDYPDNDSLENHFGQPRIGTISIDPSMATGSFKFHAA